MSAAIIFDLDGTLLDTLQDLADSTNAALRQMGHPPHPTEDYKQFVGDGVVKLAQRALPPQRQNDEDHVMELVARTRKEYGERWNATTGPYPGVGNLLDALQQRSNPFAVFSNKPDDFTRLCVRELLGKWEFAEVRGQRDGTPPKPDPAGALAVAKAMERDPAEILYLGDTNTDMQTAVAAGFHPIGALWGFRGEAELRESGAADLLRTPTDLLSLLQDR